jgi:hypothetical protein
VGGSARFSVKADTNAASAPTIRYVIVDAPDNESAAAVALHRQHGWKRE